MKERKIYICHSMPYSQYKSEENTENYVHIFASLFKLMYILLVFYIIILSICHKFIDFSISGGSIPRNLYHFLQGNNHKIVGSRGTKVHWINTYQFILSVCMAIIPRDSAQGLPSPIGLIPIHFYCLQGNNIKRVVPRGANTH